MLEQTLNQLYQNRITPYQAVRLANYEIGGIAGAKIKENYSIQNNREAFSIPIRNLTKKEVKKLEEFLVLAYWFAQQQGSTHPGEIHISSRVSSKHHKKGFLNYLQELLTKYRGENEN